MVICAITTPTNGSVYDVFMHSIMVLNILTITSCFVYLFSEKKVRISNVFPGSTSVKEIYRSLIITSLTVVFGWLSTMIIIAIANFQRVEI
uniref:G_PROTEIN_RECEP_F1_2 domain-containing protein n=1 Tax=Angiostrongylus cantonensis TaxID=6313 RepID=A0A0K0D7F8_ANGCA